MTKSRLLAGVAVLALLGGGLVYAGVIKLDRSAVSGKAPPAPSAQHVVVPLAVTVHSAEPRDFRATVLVTGSLVARNEILVGPEVDGLRVTELLADVGDVVKKGQPLARLVSATLEAQLAQNTASLARSDAAIAQANSAIVSAEARLSEAQNAYDRAMPLSQKGVLSDSGMDQRDSARRTSEAALASARHGLAMALAEKAQIEAQRREIVWRRARTEIRAPADGLVARRTARVGSYASGLAEPMFSIIANGEIELDAEVTEMRLGEIRVGQQAAIEVAGAGTVEGTVRLISPAIDPQTRLGRVRVHIGRRADLRTGAFARGRIETSQSRGLAIPASAVLRDARGAAVQVVVDGHIATRRVKLGLADGNMIEIRDGLKAGEPVVARAGTFLRDGDAVRPVPAERRRVSEAR